MKQAIVYWKTLRAGILTESDEGYSFVYDKDYLSMPEAQGISLTMPLREEPFLCNTLHPFFDGLILRDGCWILLRRIGSSMYATAWLCSWRGAETALEP